MADPELEALRQRRLAELQAQGGGQGPSPEEMQRQRREQEQAKNSMLASIMDPSARSRLASLRAVKPENAAMVENYLIQAAQRGQLHGKVGEEDLKHILAQVAERTAAKTTISFNRRQLAGFEDDDQDYGRGLRRGDDSDSDSD
ncbi:uncharacterized protein MONBRDRAFT_38192 [Monosiga brevicollis MX1]|uniref:Programmed cell death protein 5 n=1 Tax=Monosiga brevicollis TaxID=81824 RepID=A9V679_MONBE|nr:uncharacterized protein MONBRDRAFT_38192 [Monosiga brevicollis MX1]EDQ87024.1 predicted protein [Monosiga brevicollis MX1]|eukprot:XP_001748263.1 hypothetical protein [Monosiga brevicollis MX1]